jgi:hypothetical protein
MDKIDHFSPPPIFQPGRLWSLWDIMTLINAGGCFGVLQSLARIEQMMLDTQNFGKARAFSIGEAERKLMVEDVKWLRASLNELGFTLALQSADRVLSALSKGDISKGQVLFKDMSFIDLELSIRELGGRTTDELRSRLVIFVPHGLAQYYEQAAPFGEEVNAAFPATAEDISEAGKCLSLDRGTAAVFHLMRALEAAVQLIANKIGAAITDEHGKGLPWGVIADNMKPKIDKMAKGSDEQIRWYRVQNSLVVVNRAWRVPTNHPKQTYTPEQAREVFDATKGFMKELVALV